MSLALILGAWVLGSAGFLLSLARVSSLPLPDIDDGADLTLTFAETDEDGAFGHEERELLQPRVR